MHPSSYPGRQEGRGVAMGGGGGEGGLEMTGDPQKILDFRVKLRLYEHG